MNKIVTITAIAVFGLFSTVFAQSGMNIGKEAQQIVEKFTWEKSAKEMKTIIDDIMYNHDNS